MSVVQVVLNNQQTKLTTSSWYPWDAHLALTRHHSAMSELQGSSLQHYSESAPSKEEGHDTVRRSRTTLSRGTAAFSHMLHMATRVTLMYANFNLAQWCITPPVSMSRTATASKSSQGRSAAISDGRTAKPVRPPSCSSWPSLSS